MNQFAEAFKKSGIVKDDKIKKGSQKEKSKKPSSPRPNLGWLFYRDYFNAIKDYRNINRYTGDIQDIIKDKILNYTINKEILKQKKKPQFANETFELTTIYPGLLIGSGYLHELPKVDGQAILGFDFDYTTGLPIIRGSSIKGVLRSAFKHKEYIEELLKSNEIDNEELIKEIFESGKDIFFDAEIINYKESILSDDYITPHNDPLKNPIPLRFIKISPGVTFRFSFRLEDGILSSKEKIELFKNIILDLGIGAKTNVGYGKFVK